MGRKPIPKPCFLDGCEYLGFVRGERRWRDPEHKVLYTWDNLHSEIEAFNYRGQHLGALDAMTGRSLGKPVRGRKIDV